MIYGETQFKKLVSFRATFDFFSFPLQTVKLCRVTYRYAVVTQILLVIISFKTVLTLHLHVAVIHIKEHFFIRTKEALVQ